MRVPFDLRGGERVRWRNGLGWTRELLAVPSAEEWEWRLSVATSDGEAAFSAYPGVERELLLLAGTALVLRCADGDVRLTPGERHLFPGEAAVVGVPVDGPTEQLNLMWRRGTPRPEVHLHDDGTGDVVS